MDQASISATIQTYSPQIDGKVSYRTAGIIWTAVKKECKYWEAEGAKAEAAKHVHDGTAPMTQEERELYAAKVLDGALRSGEMSISELDRFKTELGLESSGRDINIELIDYKDVYPDDANAYAVAGEMIRKGIEEANSEAELHCKDGD